MKKLLAMLLALCMVFALCACGQQAAAPTEEKTEAADTTATEAKAEEPAADVGDPVNLIFSIAAVPTDAQ